MDVLRDTTGHGIQRIERGDRALSLKEGESRFGIPRHRLRLLLAAGLIDGFRLGRSVFLSERTLVDFMKRAK